MDMICKKDIIVWFKELESYKRIDIMCTLLNMCLPFELRFLGTCLEELGRRDSQELRGIELRVNNPQDLALDMMTCQKGEPTDKKMRRKMALYLALIRACNRPSVVEISRTLDGWGRREFHNMDDLDALQELLLVYTMAANHPVFSFEQHLKFTDIFEKIKGNKLLEDETDSKYTCLQPHSILQNTEFFQQRADVPFPPTQQEIITVSDQRQAQTVAPSKIQGTEVNSQQKKLTKVLPNKDSSVTELRSIIRNDIDRSDCMKTENYLPHQHVPISHNIQSITPDEYALDSNIVESIQNRSLFDGVGSPNLCEYTSRYSRHNESAGSDSGSSAGSFCEISPPDSPTLKTTKISNTIENQENDQHDKRNLQQCTNALHKGVRRSPLTKYPSSTSEASIYTPSNENRPGPLQQQYFGKSIIFAPVSNTNAVCLLQTSANNFVAEDSPTANNVGEIFSSNTVSTNNNAINGVRIRHTTTTTTNSVIQQHQYSVSLPYRIAHHAAPMRRSLMVPSNATYGPYKPNSLRLPSFPMPPNGEIICPAYSQAGLSFLSRAIPAVTTNLALTTSLSNNMHKPSSSLHQTQHVIALNAAHHSTPSYASLSLTNLSLSCYNCGSQTHIGRDCHESSMDDVSRKTFYKLDYSTSSSSPSPMTIIHSKSNRNTVCINTADCENDPYNTERKSTSPHITTHVDISLLASTNPSPPAP